MLRSSSELLGSAPSSELQALLSPYKSAACWQESPLLRSFEVKNSELWLQMGPASAVCGELGLPSLERGTLLLSLSMNLQQLKLLHGVAAYAKRETVISFLELRIQKKSEKRPQKLGRVAVAHVFEGFFGLEDEPVKSVKTKVETRSGILWRLPHEFALCSLQFRFTLDLSCFIVWPSRGNPTLKETQTLKPKRSSNPQMLEPTT